VLKKKTLVTALGAMHCFTFFH